MITKEERAEVRKAFNEGRKYSHEYYKDCIRKYEDTVTELEERLKGVVSEDKEMQELMHMWDLKGIAKDELDGYEQAVILELIGHCENIVSQLEKGDKDNANNKEATL